MIKNNQLTRLPRKLKIRSFINPKVFLYFLSSQQDNGPRGEILKPFVNQIIKNINIFANNCEDKSPKSNGSNF
jgi:hypothetical protein